MKLTILTVVIVASVRLSLADRIWPIAPMDSGFGANGSYAVTSDSFTNPAGRGKKVFVFHPSNISLKFPVLLFCHDFGTSDPRNYAPLINNLVSRGHVVVYASCKPLARDRIQKKKYNAIIEGFESAVRRFSSIIDTTRVGIIGHSYGGGAAPAIGWHCFAENQWGANGALMFIMAPWYSYFISQEELEAFPSRVHLIVEIFHDDIANDPRMAIDIFENTGIADSQKTFIELYGDSMPGYRFTAGNATPQGPRSKASKEDALDFFGIYKFIDAEADFIFKGDSSAKKIAFGIGTDAQRFMGIWPDGRPVLPCGISHRPPADIQKRPYANVWESALNPRRRESPTFYTEINKNRFYYARKAFRNYWEYEKEKRRQRRAARNAPIDSSLCAFQPIAEGFGAQGPFQMRIDSIAQPKWKGRFVHVFSPESSPAKHPVIFFCHGYTSSNPENYLPFIAHIVSKGYTLIFSPYQTIALDPKETKKYATLEAGFDAAVARFGDIIDTTRIGYVGHSFGAGAIPAVALQGLVEKNWGANGVFLYLMAPWYSYEVDDLKLKLFPQKAKMVIEVFADDKVDDHRMAISLFNAMRIPANEKSYFVLYGDTCGGCRLSADHYTPKGPFDPRAEEDALDYYGIYRIFDALAAYTFDNNSAAQALLFGGGKELGFMGIWPNGKPVTKLISTAQPVALHSQNYYSFSWGSPLNPLRKTLKINE